MVTFKKQVLIRLDADVHYQIKIINSINKTNLSKVINTFLKEKIKNHNQRK